MFAFRNNLKKIPVQRITRRRMGGGGHGGDHGAHHAHEPHIPKFYGQLGKVCLVSTYLWFFYRLKQDNGQLFGMYKPWLHEHEHGEHLHFIDNGVDTIPSLEEHEHDDEEDEEEEH